MDLSNYSEYIQKKMSEKGINTETQDYVIQYICMNQELFGNYLNIDKVLDRIINKLNCSISSSLFDNIDIKRPIKDFIELTHISGCWFPHRNEIYINPIIKLKTMLSQKERKRTLSTIMHEMDHCATTEYIDQQEIEQYFQAHSEYYKNNIEKKEMIEKITNEYYKKNAKIPVSGIADYRQNINMGVELDKLNEGITSYKQEMYGRFFNRPSIGGYYVERKVAKFIGNVIGEQKLISMHFNKDYEGIRTSFNETTGGELNDLVEELNDVVQKLRKNSYLKNLPILKKIYFSKTMDKLDKFMEKYKKNDLSEERIGQSTRNDFRKSLTKDSYSLEEQALNSKRIQEKSEKTNINREEVNNIDR